MTIYFWAAMTVMTVVAFAFLIRPFQSADRRKAVLILAVLVPVFAAGMYLRYGSPDVESGRSIQAMSGSVQPVSSAQPTSEAQSASNEKVGSVSSMLEGLSQRLADNPDDGKGWLLLARSYKHINRTDDALDAYAKAAALGEHDAELAALRGIAALEPTSDAGLAQIFGKLSLSQRASEVVLPTDTVFIFARALEGSRVPAAVLQRPASDLPIDFLLNDSQSMAQGIKLSDFEDVIVTARISRSGNATEALQNLEAKTTAIHIADGKHVNLIIE